MLKVTFLKNGGKNLNCYTKWDNQLHLMTVLKFRFKRTTINRYIYMKNEIKHCLRPSVKCVAPLFRDISFACVWNAGGGACLPPPSCAPVFSYNNEEKNWKYRLPILRKLTYNMKHYLIKLRCTSRPQFLSKLKTESIFSSLSRGYQS